jgi:hypothetical protein
MSLTLKQIAAIEYNVIRLRLVLSDLEHELGANEAFPATQHIATAAAELRRMTAK